MRSGNKQISIRISGALPSSLYCEVNPAMPSATGTHTHRPVVLISPTFFEETFTEISVHLYPSKSYHRIIVGFSILGHFWPPCESYLMLLAEEKLLRLILALGNDGLSDF